MKTTKNFDKWFADNYDKLKDKCLITNLFGELMYNYQQDIFHDAYLVARSNVLGEDTKLFEVTFLSAFKQASKRSFIERQKEITPQSLFWSFLSCIDEDEDEEVRKNNIQKLADEVKKFARATFSKDEFNLLELYFRYTLNMSQIASVFGCSAPCIYQRLTKMQGILFNKFMNEFKAL